MEKKVFVLSGLGIRSRAMACVAEAPLGYVIEIKAPTRSLEMNAKFHAMCADISRQSKWSGKPWTPEQWKVFLVSAHAIATGEKAEVVSGLEGELVNIRESTAQMSTKRGSSLIEYTQAWGDEHSVEWTDPR